jgi:hypothetical protein
MKRLLFILLLAAGTAYGQINNPPTSVNIVDSTATGRAVLTATNAAAAATAIGLGATNFPTFRGLEIVDGDALYINPSGINADGFGGVLGFEERQLAQDGAIVFAWGTESFAVTPAATFSTNVTVNGALTVGSLATTTPSTWALDATQTAAATNGALTLPSNANVIRLTNNNAISSVTNGVLGAFYYLVNQATNAVTISNVGGITIDGAQNLTLSPNESATLVATGPTNVSVAARGDLTDVALGGTANTAPSQTASSGSSLMTRDLSDARYGESVRAGVSGVALTTNNTTLEDIAGLSISLGVGLHQITTQVFFQANAAAGSKMAMTFSGSGTPSGQRQTITTSLVQAVAIGSFASTSSATADLVNHFRIYTINVTAAGTLQVQGAQNVAGSNSITATGFLKAERL